MLLKDFFFSFRNLHISHYERGQIFKLLKIGLTTIYKYVFLELFLYNLFYKKDLDKTSQKTKNLFSQDLLYLFEHFGSLKKDHSYESSLHENLKDIKNDNLDILEVGSAKGDGIASFYFYFPNSNLIAADNNPFRNRYKSSRIRNIYLDISSKKILSNFSKFLNKKFDLIIEDCSHQLIHQILCFSENFKNLKKGGIYIVEDLNFPEVHTMYNPTNELMNLKKILLKIQNKEDILSDYLSNDEISYLKDNIEDIKFYTSKNKNNYLISGVCDYSEIAFIKKK
jgi:hypothetical protein